MTILGLLMKLSHLDGKFNLEYRRKRLSCLCEYNELSSIFVIRSIISYLKMLGKYKLESGEIDPYVLLGTGGSSNVYKAIHESGVPVALKVFHERNKTNLKLLKAEVGTLRRVAHRNVICVIEHSEEDKSVENKDMMYISLELA